jgi:hypothetical protein
MLHTGLHSRCQMLHNGPICLNGTTIQCHTNFCDVCHWSQQNTSLREQNGVGVMDSRFSRTETMKFPVNNYQMETLELKCIKLREHKQIEQESMNK